ncbi:MAG: TonB-dependent receptor [Xanthomonadaceae bacterium]|nr:TonB-dependent receptor [Xanthomonadaceae bacterium]MDE2176839.1 TonB-dependent receptor [Xanthomonadaceae bacterium]
MKLDTNKLSSAVRLALAVGAVAAAGVAVPAFAQDTGNAAANPPSDKKAQQLETIVVTGSRIRRVDIETANPVFAIDRQTITQSGAVTLGDLVQQTPAIAGQATNTQVNNGGGDGAATISLRGLGVKRTLILIDGHRMVQDPSQGAPDINTIPAAMVERVEVLKDGASSVYGSDAIGGVVNFIMRKNYQGAEFSTNYGVSDASDGARQGWSALFGQTSDKGSIVAGIDYNKYDSVSSNNRSFSKNALYLYYGSVFAAGSSRNPNGRIFLPAGNSYGCGSVTKLPGTDGTATSDYRCYNGKTDAYNYQAVNLLMTPQERVSFFTMGTYQLTDNIQAYMDVFHNKTTSNYAIAPYPFDANSAGVTISQYNMYNPFGVTFGPGGATQPGGQVNFMQRFLGLGQREQQYATTTDQVFAGLRGGIGETSWQWDADLNYGHTSQGTHTSGFVNTANMGPALGPSMLVGGVPTCVGTPGDPTTAIAGCTPLNIFNINDPAQTALLRNYIAAPFTQQIYISREASVNANGNLFELPAGTVSLAVGALYRKEYTNQTVSTSIQTNPLTFTCPLGTGCTSPVQGGFNVKEAYAEVLIPVLKDMPFAKSLNVDLGSRYSKYSSVGNTTNSKIAIEWRPIDDLLLRGTISQVFRAPSISEIYGGPASDAPTFQDPCIGYYPGTSPASQNAACGAPTGATAIPVGGITPSGVSQTNGVVSGANYVGYTLKPEAGKSFDWGFVYDPSWLPGFSTSVDFWRIYLNNTLTRITAQNVVNICFANPTSPFCSFIHRLGNGQIQVINEPNVNLGRLDTSGVDFGFKYRLPQFNVFGVDPGNFAVNFDSTYISTYNNNAAPGTSVATLHNAGVYTSQFGNFPRWRALGALNWNRGAWNASWRLRYIGTVKIGSADLAQHLSADGGIPGTVRYLPSVIYNDLSLGYNIAPINTKLQIGVNNAFNKLPPLFYQNVVINANTDVNTYDVIGRYYWASATVKF